MKRVKGKIKQYLLLFFYFSLFIFHFSFVLACEKNTTPARDSLNMVQSPFASYRDIPGITEEEIAAIEALQRENKVFVYGMTLSTEAFLMGEDEVNASGIDNKYQIGGYTALFCRWLSKLLDIEFRPEIYAWSDLFEKLNSGEIDFVGNLTPTEERRKTYFMTDSIAERQYRTMQIGGSPALDRIAQERPLKYGFLQGAITADIVASVSGNVPYETILVSNFAEAYNALEKGDIDAFIGESVAEASFDVYGNVHAEDFFPLIIGPVSMTTANAEFKHIISVITKAQRNGAMLYLNDLYNQGHEAYRRHKFFILLDDDEKAYLRNTVSVPMAARSFNYPVDFYNSYEKKWDGIVFDILHKVEELSGLGFEVINEQNVNLSSLLGMVREGKAHIVPELLLSEERRPLYLWMNYHFIKDKYALLSKSYYPNVSVNEISYKRVGVIKDTARAELFRSWFPNAINVMEYSIDEDAFLAMERGEIDLIMASENRLLSILNYYELSDYKANFLFNYPYESTFGFNKDQTVLCSIMDKALPLIDTSMITEQWLTKTYDFRARLLEAQRPWLIGAAILSFTVFAMLLILLYRSYIGRKRLAKEEAQELVNEANEYAHIMFDIAPFAGCLFDKNYDMFDCNQEMVRMCGSPNKEYILQRHTEFVPEYQDDGTSTAEVLDENFRKAYERGYLQFELMHRKLSGEIFPVKTTLLRIKYRGEDMIASYFMDLTEQKAAEQLVRQRAEADAANRAKSAFLASMSHEIRTPMNAILGITEIQLQNRGLSTDIKNALNIIYNSGYSLLGIINDLLDLSKIEAGKLELMNERYETASLINDTINLNTARIGSKPIEFKLHVEEDLPFEIIGDELRVKQILNNLLSNAFKYTNSGEVHLTFHAEITGDGGADNRNAPSVKLTIIVWDTGQGMTEEQMRSLFDAYSRFNMKANKFVEGTGLGMNIVQHLVNNMGGDISVESELGKGSKFTVHIMQGYSGPAKIGEELAENLRGFRLAGMSKMKKAQIVREHMPYGKVLVVDDMETNLYVAKGFLLPYGLTVDTSISGHEAIKKIEHGNEYDIVFMDHMMPVMDGIEAVKAIRAMGYIRPIVALTANAVAGQADIFMANGFDGFISKPIDIRELNASLNKFIRDKQPPEVVEAARAAYSGSVTVNTVPQVNPELAKIFIIDAEKAIAVLQEYEARKSYGSEELQMYIISTHALKSALANIGEKTLSILAQELEQAGRERNVVFLSEKAPVFLGELQAVVDKLRPDAGEDSTGDVSDEDIGFLQKMLQNVKEACAVYDIDAANAVLTGLKQRQWSSSYGEVLDIIAGHLRHSDFSEAEAACVEFLSNMEKNRL